MVPTMAIKFQPAWLQPVPSLTSDQLSMFGKWLDSNMGLMPVADRDRAKPIRRAIKAEQSRRREEAALRRVIMAARRDMAAA
jgi:hypothetical protein